ncbi:MAG: hypothetical protein ACFHU9_02015 [Fluviicola sp.]
MQKSLLILVNSLFVSTFMFAQNVGIGTNTPDASAKLEIDDANRGVLINRVSLTAVTNGTTPVNGPATGLLVYNTNAAVTGGDGEGFYHWDGTQWSKLITTQSDDWSVTGNAGTNPATNFVGTTDAQDFVVRTNNTEQVRVESGGDVGVGTNDPEHKLHVEGDIRFEGDFINQELLGAHSGTVQSVPFTNLTPNPLTGTTNSITIQDGNGINNSAVLITGFARVFGGSLDGTNSSMGGYFIVLERANNPAFTGATILTYTSGACYIETPNNTTSASIGFGGGGHISYVDDALVAGNTYYYRLTMYPNGVGITSGNYEVYQRDLNIIQIKR